VNLIFKHKTKEKVNGYVSLILTIIITIIALLKGEVSVFYIIFLFYIETVITTILDMPRFMLGKFQVKSKVYFIITYVARLIMLGIYGAGVIGFFGLLFITEQYEINIFNSILKLKHEWFNYNLLFIIITKVIGMLLSGKHGVITYKISNSRDIILHFSILLGAFIMLYSKGYPNQLKLIAKIAPFLVAKIYFDVKNMRNLQ
jgi:hypothetical protein